MQYSIVNTDYELQLCLALRRKVFVIEQGIPVDLEIDHYDAAPHECVHGLIIAEDGEAAATGRLISYGENSGKLQRIAVRKEMRGSGVGREIVNLLEQQAIAGHFSNVLLDAQCSAEAFYTNLGYVTLSVEPFLDAGIWHVRMKKDLTAHYIR
ncbi:MULTISPECIES: GNAT family N-acetyltransferase [Pelosinus]|jgi:predicted GNAT family N-acyltransferase|uniref:GCN5-related N-acetyltransferase n=1 Tax=Pelosinus fermentans B4 TaxID=1149862 RepID=I8RGY0_9FIRM|nr:MULTISPECIES: GNAT family N-acetyltransferase [Pelosinus]EIW17085.1 GCN5-related N-acetyltransferase [Pelosinus fermentans B4]EIW23116.1 GCN5-related N-acetyltransferase [Pelosinus fermentans A11]OAM93842.1 GCN5-related N-acetyltransferase [Pelosinus fermentans DSM 17108]SDQ91959.1 Predicted N-acyltransferase, GNAT family [Pelosinus fermentans]